MAALFRFLFRRRPHGDYTALVLADLGLKR